MHGYAILDVIIILLEIVINRNFKKVIYFSKTKFHLVYYRNLVLNLTNAEYVEINLAKPDNNWYYILLETGEQVLLGNFSEKVTITGVIGQVVVGEIPFVGTAADIRDIGADIVNWEWTWQHAGTTALDVIGLVPIIGAFKYADEAGEVLTAGVKHLDDVGDVGKKSDELAEVVGESIVKHFDETSEIATSTIKNFDELQSAVKNPEIFSENALEHIFLGNKTGGYHYEGLQDANGKVLNIVSGPDVNGVYMAEVEINGKVKRSSFFPKNWSVNEVLNVIEKVYDKCEKIPNSVSKVEIEGITYRIIINSNNNIESIYPLMN